MLVFVSHSSKDRLFVEQRLIPFLQGQAIRPWYSTLDIRTAGDWERGIREALESCDFVLVVLSPNSVSSEWVRAEVHWAMENRKGCVVPVLIADCKPFRLHLKLALIEHVDLQEDSTTAWEKLAAVWTRPSYGQQTQQAKSTESGCRVGDHYPWTPRTVRLGLRFNVLDHDGRGIVFSENFIDILSSHCVESPPSDLDELRRTLLASILDTTPVKITIEELTEFAGVAHAHLMDLILEISTQSQILSSEDGAYSVTSGMEDELLDSLAENPPLAQEFRESVLQLFCEMSRARLLLYAGEHAAKWGLVGGVAFTLWRGHDRLEGLAEALDSRQ